MDRARWVVLQMVAQNEEGFWPVRDSAPSPRRSGRCRPVLEAGADRLLIKGAPQALLCSSCRRLSMWRTCVGYPKQHMSPTVDVAYVRGLSQTTYVADCRCGVRAWAIPNNICRRLSMWRTCVGYPKQHMSPTVDVAYVRGLSHSAWEEVAFLQLGRPRQAFV
jgi:hypothetical protein